MESDDAKHKDSKTLDPEWVQAELRESGHHACRFVDNDQERAQSDHILRNGGKGSNRKTDKLRRL